MLLGSSTRSGVAQGRSLLRERHKLGKRGNPKRRVDGEDHRLARDLNDRNQVLQGVERQLEEMRGARNVIGRDQNGVAVGGASDSGFDADHATRAGPVLDKDLLPDAAGEVIGEEPRRHIGRAARRIRHKQTDRPCRPILGGSDPGHERHQGEQRGEEGVAKHGGSLTGQAAKSPGCGGTWSSARRSNAARIELVSAVPGP